MTVANNTRKRIIVIPDNSDYENDIGIMVGKNSVGYKQGYVDNNSPTGYDLVCTQCGRPHINFNLGECCEDCQIGDIHFHE